MDPNTGYVTPAPSRSIHFSRRTLIIGAGLVVTLITAIALLLSSGGKSTSTQTQHLVARLNNLQEILTDTKTIRNIKNENLSNIITSGALTVTTDINTLSSTLATNYPSKIDESILATESDTTTAKTIEDAYLENKLDAVYADVVRKKIASLRALIAEIYGLTNSASYKEALVEIDDHMRSLSEQLEDLTL